MNHTICADTCTTVVVLRSITGGAVTSVAAWHRVAKRRPNRTIGCGVCAALSVSRAGATAAAVRAAVCGLPH